MSAVFGVLRTGGRRVGPDDLAPMSRALRMWGADGLGTWRHGSVGLGQVLHRDSPAEREETGPVESANAPGVVLVADVRLGARADLVRELGMSAPDARSLCDAQLVLRAYLRWGQDCVKRLLGAFAFAVWDGRRDTLFCVRDHLGLRPLHYWTGPQGFVLATDYEAVLACPGVPRRVDEEALVARLVHHHPTLRARSLYEGVLKVEPGELLIVKPGAAPRRVVHWAPGPRRELRLSDPREYAEALRATLDLVVADATLSTRAVGTHLSGGLDSSSVAVLADRALRRRGSALALAYSWAPPPDGQQPVENDERVRAQQVADALGVPLGFTALGPAERLAVARREAALEPNETTMYEFAVVRDAARQGIGVLLSGWGGDELASFNGRGHLASLARAGRWRAMLRDTSALTRRISGLRGPRLAYVVVRQLCGRALMPLVPEPLLHALRVDESPAEARLRRERGMTWGEVHQRAPELRRDVARRLVRASVRENQLALLRNGHLTLRIEAWARMSAPAGIDYRFPLLDPRVIDLCLSFPGALWLHDGWKRWVYRAAMDPLLPEQLCWGDPKDEPAFVAACRTQVSVRPEIVGVQTPPEVARLVEAHGRYAVALAAVTDRKPPPRR